MLDLAVALLCLNSFLLLGVAFALWRRPRQQESSSGTPFESLGARLFPLTERLASMRQELERARRYERHLTVAVLQMTQPSPRKWARKRSFRRTGPDGALLVDSLAVGMVTIHALRTSDILAYDAADDQFVLCLPEVERTEAEQLLARVGVLVRQRTRVSIQAGIAELATDGWTLEDLISTAVNEAQGKPQKPKAAEMAVGVGA